MMIESTSRQTQASGDSVLSGPAADERTMSSSGGDGSMNLLEGYKLEHTATDSVLYYDLPDGRQWKKRIWTRKSYPKKLFRWNSTEELLSYLISFDQHDDWISTTVPQKPPSGTILFFHRKQTKQYRSDGYEWKTRKTINTVREDRMKLKVGGYQLLYGCYVHSASNQNFHRRSYWLIQNPDLIVVHYLELDSSNGLGARFSPDPSLSQELEECVKPTTWGLLTISDCNLCALLSMVHTSEATKALLTQLTVVLDQNVGRALTLEEAIELNNYGLPEDMFKDTRSRKMKIIGSSSTSTSSSTATTVAASTSVGSGGGVNKKERDPALQAAMSNFCSDSQSLGETSSLNSNNGTTYSKVIDIGRIMSNANSNSVANSSNASSVSVESAQNSDVLNTVPNSQRVVFCCPKQGPLSYLLQLATSLSPSPATSSSSSGTQGLASTNRRILPSPSGVAAMEDGDGSINLSSCIKTLFDRGKATTSRKKDKVVTSGGGEGVGGGRNRRNGFSSEVVADYDAEKFSQFANILVNMDGVGGVHSLAGGAAENNHHGNHHHHHHHLRHQQHQQQSSRTHLLTSSGSDVEFTDSLESENSVMQQGDTGDDDGREEVMDFASIVSAAVASNSDAASDRDHPNLSLLPEIPMSWLKVPNNHHAELSSPTTSSSASHSLITTAASSSSSSNGSNVATSTTNVVTVVQPVGNLPSPSPHSSSSTTPAHTEATQPAASIPQESRLLAGPSSTEESSLSAGGGGEAVGSQVQNIDQPMADESQSASEDILDVSLDLDSESLQHLLSFSGSPPRLHQTSSTYQPPPLPLSLPTGSVSATTTDTAPPLSPISQLFDRLEPAPITSPGGLSLTGPQLHINHEQKGYCHDNNHDHTITSGLGCLSTNISTRHSLTGVENQDINVSPLFISSSVGHTSQMGVAGLSTSNNDVVSSSWASSPNSLQLWLESTSGAFDDSALLPTSSESTTTIVGSSIQLQSQAMDVDNSTDLTSADLPQELSELIAQTDLPHRCSSSSSAADNSCSAQPQLYSQSPLHLQGSNLAYAGNERFHSGSNNVSECDFNMSHQSDPNHNALYDSTEHFPGPFDVFCAHPDQSLGSYHDDTSVHHQVQRKSSNTSISSEPLLFDSLRVPPTMYGASEAMCNHRHHLSLPNLTNLDANDQGQCSSSSLLLEASQTGGSPIQCGSGTFTSSPCSHRSISPGVVLPDIPEGVQIRSPHTNQYDPSQFNVDLLQYRTSSPVPSSPSIASVSSRSTVSTHEFFESESPSVVELCEMLSESPNVRHQDFSHMVLSEAEQQQLFRSAQVIQNAFRSYKSRRQIRDKEKNAALLIENYYKNYVQMKHEKDRAARRIQQQYRIYKSRTKELNRAAVFIQQMYRYQKHRKVPHSSSGGPSRSRPGCGSSASQSNSTSPPTSQLT